MIRKLAVLLVLAALGLSLLCLPPSAEAAETDWVVSDTSPIGRLVFAYAELPDGKIFVSTGANMSDVSITNETWLYDPYEETWERVADCINKTESSTAVAMPDGKVYMFGGMYGSLNDHVMIYDVASDTWSYGSYLAEEVIIAEAVALDDHRILVAGGLSDNFLNSATEHCWIYDTESSLFTPAADLPSTRCCGSMVVYGNYAYYLGGMDAAMTVSDEVLAYNINGDYWSSVGYLPVPLINFAAVAGSEGNIYIIGGEGSFNWYATGSENAFAYNIFTGNSIILPELPSPVLNAAAFELSDGRIMYLLGNNGSEANTDVITLKTWTAEASLSAASVDQGGSVWLHIGVDTNYLNMYGLSGVAYLVKGNVTYGAFYIDSSGENEVALELTISEELPAGDYLVVLSNVNIGYGWEQDIPFEPLALTVNEAPSTDEQNQALQDKLDELELQNQNLSDQLDALEQQNDELANDLAELKEANDAKLDAMIGYIILILVIVTLVVAVLVLVRKK